MIIDWGRELPVYWRCARGDMAVYCALVGLRKAEGGRPGNELGVESVAAPTLTVQAEVAVRSFHNSEVRYGHATGLFSRDVVTGLFTDAFLTFFSHRWAPPKAPDDPTNLNANHAHNLTVATRAAAQSLENRALGITA